MKQRFSSLDVKVIAHELADSLVSLRLANVYDLSSKIMLFKFAKPNNKKQLVVDSGFRCHLTDFVRATAPTLSGCVVRLRKYLKTRRVTGVTQVGTDRILEIQFSDGQFRLFFEFFAGGNVILTDAALKILTLLRNVPEGERQEPQRVGLQYSIENRQNYGGTPPLTKERVRTALAAASEKAAIKTAATTKKFKVKPREELRRAIALSINELPPMLFEHAMSITGFKSQTTPAEVLADEAILDHLVQALAKARDILDEITASTSCAGYIFAKQKPKSDTKSPPVDPSDGASRTDVADPDFMESKRTNLLYDEFSPFLPYEFSSDHEYQTLKFDSFNKAVDEYFSSVEGQKLESRLNERELMAYRKLEATKRDQAMRVQGLQAAQILTIRKATAIEANVERVEEAIEAIGGLIDQGMDWADIGKLVEREQRKGNVVAQMIRLPLRLSENIITLLLGEEEEVGKEEEEVLDETDSERDDDGDDDDGDAARKKAEAKRLDVDIDITISPWSNAREYYDQQRTASVKEAKTVKQSEMAIKNAEKKITSELKKGLQREKALLQPIRKQMWFEKFHWFISSDGYLVIGGKDASQNEMLYKKYLRKGDIYCHADLHGAASIIIKNNPSTPDAPMPPATLSQAGNFSVCSSNAWDSKAGMAAWWVNADQVSKSAPTGEFLTTGSFMVRGKKNFLPPTQLLMGLGVLFRISEESKAKHVKHRLRETDETADDDATAKPRPDTKLVEESAEASPASAETQADDDEAVGENDERVGGQRGNPLQPDSRPNGSDGPVLYDEEPSTRLDSLDLNEELIQSKEEEGIAGEDANDTDDVSDLNEGNNKQVEDDVDEEPGQGNAPTQPTSKKAPPRRGQRAKQKKLAKYKDQDEDDRAAFEALTGSRAGRERAEALAKLRAEREAEHEAQRDRRRAQHQRQQKETAEHEEIRRLMLEEGVEVLEADEAEKATALDVLVGAPLPGDEILEAIAVCAPWNALTRFKYKAKMQPGQLKKGKAVKEVLDRWRADSSKKSSVDETAQDPEKIWPREIELIKALKSEEVVNCIPVSKVKVMMSGGGGGGGRGNAKGGKGKGKKG